MLGVQHLALCFGLVLTLAAHGEAQPGIRLSLPELVQRSDAICIGTITGRDMSRGPMLTVSGTLTVRVEQVLKGTVPTQTIVVTVGAEQYTPATVTHGLFLLSGNGKSQYWDLYQYNLPVIDLGTAPPRELPNNLTPLRAVVLALAQVLATSDTDNRVQLLDHLADIGIVLNLKFPPYIHLASELGETTGFGAFCVENVAPLTKALDNDPNQVIGIKALTIQAILQDQSVLPAILQTIEAGGSQENTGAAGRAQLAAEALSCYDTLATAPFMLHALHNPIHRVWYAALESLVNTLGRTATPLLIDRIQRTKDTGDQDSIIVWLYEVTGEMKPQGNDLGLGSQQKYVNYWLHWEKVHHDEIRHFRAQLAALARR